MRGRKRGEEGEEEGLGGIWCEGGVVIVIIRSLLLLLLLLLSILE